MRKKFVVLLAAGALGVGVAAPVAYGQTTETTQSEDDGGTDYGWVGLLGLAGLAGLLGRKRDDREVREVRRDDDTTRR